MQTKDFHFRVKNVQEDGTFEGFLSVYNLKDYGNDVVEPGAFTKTIQDRSSVIPMLWQHDEKQPIGSLELEDRTEGLWVKGKFLLEVERAREAYALVKAGIIRGLSIGYRAVQKEIVKGVRHLHEVQLFEGSVVTFPMNPAAQIAMVKAAQESKDFVAELERIRLHTMRWMMMDALQSCLYDCISSNDPAVKKIEESASCIDQFRAAYMEYLPQYLMMQGEMDGMESDAKAGRRLSEASRTQIAEAITQLQALLVDGDSTSEETEAAEAVSQEAAKSANEPDALNLHSWLQSFNEELKAAA